MGLKKKSVSAHAGRSGKSQNQAKCVPDKLESFASSSLALFVDESTAVARHLFAGRQIGGVRATAGRVNFTQLVAMDLCEQRRMVMSSGACQSIPSLRDEDANTARAGQGSGSWVPASWIARWRWTRLEILAGGCSATYEDLVSYRAERRGELQARARQAGKRARMV